MFSKAATAVLRARGFRLYTRSGRRIVDLWQAGGRAILGHTPPAVLKELKNTAERGLFAPLPHPFEARFIKALSLLFPACTFRVYTDESILRRALIHAGVPADAPLPDPGLGAPEENAATPVSRWRPFIDCPPATLLVPVLPWPLSPSVLVIRNAGLPDALFPVSDTGSPALLAAATRSIYDLIAAKDRGAVESPLIIRALENVRWRRRGIYVQHAETLSESAYAKLSKRFLDANFLLPPDQTSPLILPTGLSDGESAKLAKVFEA
jgi:hypothetical protein